MTGTLPDPAAWPVEDHEAVVGADPLARRAASTPDRTALLDAGQDARWTFADLDGRVDAVAAGLADRLEAGDRVATLLPAGPGFVVTLFATWRAGGSLVPLDPDEERQALADRAARAEVSVVCCRAANLEQARAIAPPAGPAASLTDLTAASMNGRANRVRAPDAERLLAFTSGTTGTPKGVRLTLVNLLASAVASAHRLDVAADDRWLVSLPVHHVGGLSPVIRSTLYGTTAVLQRGFDAERTRAVIAEDQISCVSLVPTQLTRLLDAGWRPPEQIRFVLLGGAPASAALIERCGERDVPVCPTYGTTETASQVATARPETAFSHPQTVGEPLRRTEVTILDDGDPLPAREVGEIVVDGPTVSPGYLDAERTAEAFGPHGVETGDLGYLDAEGRLWVTGRVDERIVSGGENVDPTRVARTLRDHPAVADAVVVGLPDEEWGERVAALVAGEGVGTTSLREHCRERLAPHAVPKTIRVVDALPRTASGTADRERARDLLDGA